MDDPNWITERVEFLIGRFHGPMTFRLILQPLMAVILAIRDGRKDGLAGETPYAWGLYKNPEHRAMRIREGWRSIGRIFILALILDAVYQYITVRWFYPVEALVTAVVLALLPYVPLRGIVTRLWLVRHHSPENRTTQKP